MGEKKYVMADYCYKRLKYLKDGRGFLQPSAFIAFYGTNK